MYTIEDIVHHTGVTENKAAELCSLLDRYGYLHFDRESGRYSLTNDRKRLREIKNFWEQCKDEHSFAQMCSKIEDIIKFGTPLALSEDTPKIIVEDIGIPGLNIIFGRHEIVSGSINQSNVSSFSQKVPGLPMGHCLLIKGEPGTGKTTLAMQIALRSKRYRSLFLSFEEDTHQILNNFKGYIGDDNNDENAMGWNKDDIKEITRPLIKIRTPSAWKNPDMVLNELIGLLDQELPRLVVIDSISRFRNMGGETEGRHILRKFIRNLKCRKITSIFTGEDYGNEDDFEDYEVDGIISIKWESGFLALTVKKLRGMKAYKGIHSAAMLSMAELNEPENRLISETSIGPNGNQTYLVPGMNIFPDISTYKKITTDDSQKTISTGTEGLDELLLLPNDEKGLKQGETLLLVGSAGTGKTVLALNFMREGCKKNENTIWINFEGDLETLKFATRGFEGDLKEKFNEMLDSNKTNDPDSRFKFIDFSPINIDLNKIVFTLEALHNRKNISRLVIDSITELEKAKGHGQQALKVFLSGLIQFLRDRKITTIFVCRSDAFFKSIDKITEQISSLVDLIICIRNFDVHNQIQKGIYIQKARGRKHDSKISHMVIDSQKGIVIKDQGWDIENLLAGDTGNIQAPRVFFKLFYENPAEDDINKKIIEDFQDVRYPSNVAPFALVKKPHIYTEFWSFGGQFSAGHANTRLLSIEDYVVYAFRDNKRLAPLKKYVKGELLKNIEQDVHLRKLYPLPKKKIKKNSTDINDKKEKFIDRIDAIPCYRDYGVMVFKEIDSPQCNDLINNEELIKFLNKIKSNLFDNYEKEKNEKEKNDSNWIDQQYNWDKLLDLVINTKLPEGILPFAFPPLDNVSEFVAFFMELLWSNGGDIYKIDSISTPDYEKYEKEFIKNKKKIRDSILMELKYYYPDMSDDFDKRFDFYGLKKDIKIEDFKKWLENQFNTPTKQSNEFTLDKSILWIDDSTLKKTCDSTFKKTYDSPFKETIELMLKLVHLGGVKNPAEGEFRHRALLSRNWYTRVTQPQKDQCELCSQPDLTNCMHRSHPDKNKCMEKCLSSIKYHLLPLPLADMEKKKKYRSVACVSYWSLVMLDKALSPEIGGNFIESINAPNYYQQRLSDKAGMPITNREVKIEKYREFDPESYFIFDRLLNNNVEKSKAFNCKTRQTRIGFYQIEEALHFQLKRLFIDSNTEEPNDVLYQGENIYENFKKLFENANKQKKLSSDDEKKLDGLLNEVSKEFRLHVIFEMLVYFYHEHILKEDDY
ncbi:MAG: AAA family ATPase [Acidobacteria bacterium]|nr:AAA family ATPase [Acidobacteriota bacterium]